MIKWTLRDRKEDKTQCCD